MLHYFIINWVNERLFNIQIITFLNITLSLFDVIEKNNPEIVVLFLQPQHNDWIDV